MGPFDLPGGQFLALYGALLVGAIIASLAIPRWRKPDGQPAAPRDADGMAYLAGRGERFAEALVARLLAKGALAVDGGNGVAIIRRDQSGTGAERSVLALPSPTSWNKLVFSIRHEMQAADDRLVRDGLLMDRAAGMQMRIWQTLPFALLFVFGAIKWQIGIMRDRPVGFLTALLIVTVILGLLRFVVLDRRTRGGVTVLEEARRRSDRMRRAPTNEETGMAVALFGTVVLAGSSIAAFHQFRSNSGGAEGSANSADSSSSDNSSSSGCGGGGGCGGCGGS